MATSITLKQGEAKTLRFVITENGAAVDLSVGTTSFFFGMKKKKSDTSYIVSKDDASFTTTDAAIGVISVILTATDTNQTPTTYIGELKIKFSDDSIDKSEDLTIKIDQAVIT